MDKLKIIVTGGMGYIGSHCVVELIEQGYEPIIIDDLSNSDIKILNGIERITSYTPDLEIVDLTDLKQTIAAISKYDDIAGVIHFAAYKAVGESVRQPLKYYRNNINCLINILDVCHFREIRNFIFSSSCTVYGETTELPVSESTRLNTTHSPYGVTKQLGEKIITDYLKAHENHNAISLRYFNPIGAHPSSEIGELPLGTPENLMPYITQTAIGMRDELKVFGGDYNTADGTAIRDYIHVVDLARAHVKSLKRLIEKKNQDQHEFFNLGSGKGYSVLEVIQSFERSTGMKLDYSIVDRRPGDAEAIYADTRLSREELGFEVKFSLDQMTKTAWEWEKKIRSEEQA